MSCNISDIVADETLFQEIQRGDEKAFDVLFLKYYPSLCAYAQQFVEYDDGQEKQCTFKREEDVDEMLACIAAAHPEIPTLSEGGERRVQAKAEKEAEKETKQMQAEKQAEAEKTPDVKAEAKAEKQAEAEKTPEVKPEAKAEKPDVPEKPAAPVEESEENT